MPDDDSSDTPQSLAARQAAEAHRARYPVEAAYTPPGPYATTTGTVTDGAGDAIYDLYYPEDYAALGFKSPIVTWGNGTWGIPPYYSTLLGHLASYGFSVIGTTSRETGSGVEIGDAAHYLVTQAGTAGSIFYGNLDVTRVAAAGHSQGAGGATLARAGFQFQLARQRCQVDSTALVPLPPTVARAIDRAVGGRDAGPILRSIRGTRMDRHAATRRLRVPAITGTPP